MLNVRYLQVETIFSLIAISEAFNSEAFASRPFNICAVADVTRESSRLRRDRDATSESLHRAGEDIDALRSDRRLACSQTYF